MVTIKSIVPNLADRTCAVVWSDWGQDFPSTAIMEDDDGVWYVHEWPDGPSDMWGVCANPPLFLSQCPSVLAGSLYDVSDVVGNVYTDAYDLDQVDRDVNRHF